MDEEKEKQIQEMTDKIFNEIKEKEASQAEVSSQTSEQPLNQPPVQKSEGYFKQIIRSTFSIESMLGAALFFNIVSIATSLWQYRDFTLPILECTKTDPSCGAAGGWVFFFVIIPFVLLPFLSGLLATVSSLIRVIIRLTRRNKVTTLAIVLLVASIITAIAAFITVRMMMTF